MPCSCAPCPCNEGKECNCGRFWFEPRVKAKDGRKKDEKMLARANDEPHCGVHDPRPA